MPYSIKVAARDSALSKAQLAEVERAIKLFHPEITFDPIYVKTTGDRDKKKSLRTLDKTDFFTREIDEIQRAGQCRIAIHSAKDLPEPLSDGLAIAALTGGVDPSDSLVLREGDSLESLSRGAKIATSSLRRETSVQQLREDLSFVDIRGTIEERLARLFNYEVDGVVIAQAALIRLQLTHLNGTRLPGATAPMQGRLSVIARKEDTEMFELFKCIHDPIPLI